MRYLVFIRQKINMSIKNLKVFMVCTKDFIVDSKNFVKEAVTYTIPQAVQIAAIVVLSVNMETLYRSARSGVFVDKFIQGVVHGHFFHPVFWFWFILILSVSTLWSPWFGKLTSAIWKFIGEEKVYEPGTRKYYFMVYVNAMRTIMQFFANWAMLLMVVSRIEIISGGWIGKVVSNNLDLVELHGLILYHASVLDKIINNSVKVVVDLKFWRLGTELVMDRVSGSLSKNMIFARVKDFATNFSLRDIKEYYRSACDETLNKYRVSENWDVKKPVPEELEIGIWDIVLNFYLTGFFRDGMSLWLVWLTFMTGYGIFAVLADMEIVKKKVKS